ncbi:AraC family transcriptional regulator [Streptomyces chromofuscus]|uniref:AraC family transcriptional regulator n=1 Tax=Streptomyces chromofuscus TaxID=42881 RepID=A0A7M2T9A3_STRCW|nr:AraC family transcriptional regulator [Streptomyces chromofuscus]QOV44834.1 AraC family transcriptional regulator [Streptomyces chromofuscus]GGT33536.1 AraC family transcriptional regulator [Streptomyces chromofuscus]
MDVLSYQLTRARARGAVFSALRRVAPWGLAFTGRRPLTAHILLDGAGWLTPSQEEPVRLAAGDVVLATAGDPYEIVSEVGADIETITDARRRGSDHGPGQASHIVCGAYVVEGSVGKSLLESLPRFARIPAHAQNPRHRDAISLLAAEAEGTGSGQQVLLDRLLDLNLVYALRTWWQQEHQRAPGWYRALTDPRLARVIQAIHAHPERTWRVESMARTAEMSRAGFSATFKEIIGQSPGSYLTQLRMGHAEDALLRTDATLAAIAADVGYTNEFAFATAFRRAHGLPPGQWRATHRPTLQREATTTAAQRDAVHRSDTL